MKYRKLILLIVMFLLVLPFSLAGVFDQEPEQCLTVDFYKPASWISCGLAKTSQNLVDVLIIPMEQVTETFGELMIIQIDIGLLSPYWAKINYLASAFVVLMIIYVGYLWIFASIDTEKRKIAKEQTLNLIYLTIFINLSLIFAWLLVEITNSFVVYVWQSFLNEAISDLTLTEIVVNTVSSFLLMLFYLSVFILLGIPFFIKVVTRHLVVMILVVIMPIIMLLYFFNPTRGYGKKLIEILVINAIFPFIWMLVFAMGKILVVILEDLYLPVSFGLLNFIALTSTFYVNNKLYQKIGLNFDIASPVTYTVKSVKKIYQNSPQVVKNKVRQAGGRVKDYINSKRDIPYRGIRDEFEEALDKNV